MNVKMRGSIHMGKKKENKRGRKRESCVGGKEEERVGRRGR